MSQLNWDKFCKGLIVMCVQWSFLSAEELIFARVHCQHSKESSVKPETPLISLSNIPVTAIPNSQHTHRPTHIQVWQKRLRQSNAACYSLEKPFLSKCSAAPQIPPAPAPPAQSSDERTEAATSQGNNSAAGKKGSKQSINLTAWDLTSLYLFIPNNNLCNYKGKLQQPPGWQLVLHL